MVSWTSFHSSFCLSGLVCTFTAPSLHGETPPWKVDIDLEGVEFKKVGVIMCSSRVIHQCRTDKDTEKVRTIKKGDPCNSSLSFL